MTTRRKICFPHSSSCLEHDTVAIILDEFPIIFTSVSLIDTPGTNSRPWRVVDRLKSRLITERSHFVAYFQTAPPRLSWRPNGRAKLRQFEMRTTRIRGNQTLPLRFSASDYAFDILYKKSNRYVKIYAQKTRGRGTLWKKRPYSNFKLVHLSTVIARRRTHSV